MFVSFDLRSTGSFHHAYWLIGLLNVLICVPVLGLPSPQPTSDPKPGGEAEAKQSVLDPWAWRRMLTGVESQQAVGGDWRMWFHWYACFFWYAAFDKFYIMSFVCCFPKNCIPGINFYNFFLYTYIKIIVYISNFNIINFCYIN